MTRAATAASADQSATSAIAARKESVTTPPATQTPAAKTMVALGRASQRRDRLRRGAVVAMPFSAATTTGVTDARNAQRAPRTEVRDATRAETDRVRVYGRSRAAASAVRSGRGFADSARRLH